MSQTILTHSQRGRPLLRKEAESDLIPGAMQDREEISLYFSFPHSCGPFAAVGPRLPPSPHPWRFSSSPLRPCLTYPGKHLGFWVSSTSPGAQSRHGAEGPDAPPQAPASPASFRSCTQ